MKHIIAVISGKGGVGKSTVAVNTAIALANTGAKVALIDCDMYGPSIPTLLGQHELSADHEGKLIPPLRYGIKFISIGFFLKHPDDAVIWRGPMFNTAMRQLFQDISWGEVDYCIVDMPPGTGDAQISLAQNFSVKGAVVVTTPQEVALADVRKSINMLKKVNVPILGIVENMAGFIAADGKLYDIFGSGGGARLAQQTGTELLASIPLDVAIREGGDIAKPVAADPNSPAGRIFTQLAQRLMTVIDASGQGVEQVRIVG
jgi:ATP-binding protein involved in chromosome partitioning